MTMGWDEAEKFLMGTVHDIVQAERAEELREELKEATRLLGAVITQAGGRIELPASLLLEDYDLKRIEKPESRSIVFEAEVRGGKAS